MSNTERDSQNVDEDGSGEKPASRYYGIGGGRRKALDAIEAKPRLDAVESVDSLEELVAALEAISLKQPDSSWYRSPPQDVIDTVESVHKDLPAAAQSEFLSDETLLRRVNVARRQFNDWLDRLKRVKEMPSPVEAGPANYPAEKAQRRVDSRHKAGDELADRLDKVRAGANGGRQRALEAIGSSVAEQNEKDREQTRDERRDQYSEDDLVVFRNPRQRIGKILRVNKKSIRVRYPNPRAGGTKPMSDEPEPDFREQRVQLDSDFLRPLTPDVLDEIGREHESVQTACEALFE